MGIDIATITFWKILRIDKSAFLWLFPHPFLLSHSSHHPHLSSNISLIFSFLPSPLIHLPLPFALSQPLRPTPTYLSPSSFSTFPLLSPFSSLCCGKVFFLHVFIHNESMVLLCYGLRIRSYKNYVGCIQLHNEIMFLLCN